MILFYVYRILKNNTFEEGNPERDLLSNVIPPSDIRVSFEDIGALDQVKQTHQDLIMIPLQRPDLFSKGELLKVKFY